MRIPSDPQWPNPEMHPETMHAWQIDGDDDGLLVQEMPAACTDAAANE
jgi:hypothetical protein